MKIITHIFHYLLILVLGLAAIVWWLIASQPSIQAALDNGEITGWGWTDTVGWISLNCENVYAGENQGQLSSHCDDSNYGVIIDPDSGAISGQAWSSNIGWIDFNPTVGESSIGSLPTITGGDDFAYPVAMDSDTKELSGWAVATFSDFDPNNNAWIRFRAGNTCDTSVTPAEDTYCVRQNDAGYLVGWAWSGGDNGLGWIRFEQTFSGGPYVKTEYSDVYSGGDIRGSRAPEGEYNATYCIISQSSASNITLSSSQACLVGNIDLDFPSTTNTYSTSIVEIDLDDLSSQATNNDTYFDITEGTSYDISQNLLNNGALNGAVYYFTSSDDSVSQWRLSEARAFSDAVGPNISGEGTIVIDGDLYIDQALTYNPGTPSDLSQIASVAWIVLGNVYIDPAVSEVVGTYVLLGDGTIASGKLFTGDDSSLNDGVGNQLVFSGMVIAKEIDFQRKYFVGLKAAEVFSYDGRTLVNTPPGLQNLAGYLPSWNR